VCRGSTVYKDFLYVSWFGRDVRFVGRREWLGGWLAAFWVEVLRCAQDGKLRRYKKRNVRKKAKEREDEETKKEKTYLTKREWGTRK
jgi:hypothetical protein